MNLAVPDHFEHCLRFTTGALPIMGCNYGARLYSRVWKTMGADGLPTGRQSEAALRASRFAA